MSGDNFDPELQKAIDAIPARLRYIWDAWLRAFNADRANKATPAQKRLLDKIGGRKDKREFYYRYIVSPEWKKKADEAKRRAGYRCQVCNRKQGDVILNAHHRTYENLGHEKEGDLTVLCDGCHGDFHKSGRLARI